MSSTHSPFNMFQVKDIFVTQYITFNNIHFFFVFIFFLVFIFGILFRYSKNNFVHNIVFYIWDMVRNGLNKEQNDNDLSKKNYETHSQTWFFFSMFILILAANIASRIPGLLPSLSLLSVSIPLHGVIILYFLYFSFKINKSHIIDVFFNPSIILPIRIFIGLMEIFSLLAKIFSFSIRLLANITAGHILIWVIEKFVVDMPLLLKPIPFIFLMGMYIMEMAVAVLQSYIFLLLSVNLFQSIEYPQH